MSRCPLSMASTNIRGLKMRKETTTRVYDWKLWNWYQPGLCSLFLKLPILGHLNIDRQMQSLERYEQATLGQT